MTGWLPPGVPHRVTGRRVEVTGPLPLGAGGRETARAVRFLRECQGLGLTVAWETGGAPIPYDVRPLRHLPPPAAHPGEAGEVRAWRDGHAHGLLYHRIGPGFVTVLDRRRPGGAARLTLDHPDLVAAFRTLLDPTPLAELDPGPRRAAELLAAERLTLVTGGWAVTLPPRIRRWPVPCTAV